MKHAPIIVILGLLLVSLGCSLGNLGGDATPPPSTPVDSSTWVAFVGRNVQIAAPPDDWRVVPFNLPVALEEQETLNAADPSVANVFRDLVLRFATKDDTRLLMMRNDGTAWLYIRQEMLTDTDYQTRVNAIQQSLRAQGTNPANIVTIETAMGSALRWEIAYSPQGSQIVNRQWHYAINHNGTLIYMIFDAQGADFAGYQPLFSTMTDTLQILPS